MSKSVRVEQNFEEQHSAEISLNAKKEIAFSVKAYGANPITAVKRAKAMFTELREFSTYLPALKPAPETDQGSKPLPRS